MAKDEDVIKDLEIESILGYLGELLESQGSL